MKSFWQAGKELLFPSHCLACKRQLPCWELPLFCDEFLAAVSFIGPPICPVCGVPHNCGEDHLCGRCLIRNPPFHLARSAVFYREPVASLISGLKFRKDLNGLATLASLARASTGFLSLGRPDVILPVPLHPKRLRKRGFNQANMLARALFPDKRRNIIPSLLVRKRHTAPQTGLSGRQRRKNLFKAFSVKRPEMIQGRKILLIDDVFTTGSTVQECARILQKEGAGRIEIFTVAMTPVP